MSATSLIVSRLRNDEELDRCSGACQLNTRRDFFEKHKDVSQVEYNVLCANLVAISVHEMLRKLHQYIGDSACVKQSVH